MSRSDALWNADRVEYGWRLPKPAVWWKRLPVIRHVRAFRMAAAVERHHRIWASLGAVRNPYDHWLIYAVARGWA